MRALLLWLRSWFHRVPAVSSEDYRRYQRDIHYPDPRD